MLPRRGLYHRRRAGSNKVRLIYAIWPVPRDRALCLLELHKSFLALRNQAVLPMGFLIALAFPQASTTPDISPEVFAFCAPILFVTVQLLCVLLGICFSDSVKASLRVPLK